MDINKLKLRIIDLLFSRALIYTVHFELREIRANAFFVGSDFIADKFKGHFDASNFYYKPAYSAAGRIGHSNDFGEYTSFEDYFKP